MRILREGHGDRTNMGNGAINPSIRFERGL